MLGREHVEKRGKEVVIKKESKKRENKALRNA